MLNLYRLGYIVCRPTLQPRHIIFWLRHFGHMIHDRYMKTLILYALFTMFRPYTPGDLLITKKKHF